MSGCKLIACSIAWTDCSQLALPREAQAQVVQRAGVLRIRGHGPMVERLGERQIPLAIFHARGGAEQLHVARPLGEGLLQLLPGLRHVALSFRHLGHGDVELRRRGTGRRVEREFVVRFGDLASALSLLIADATGVSDIAAEK